VYAKRFGCVIDALCVGLLSSGSWFGQSLILRSDVRVGFEFKVESRGPLPASYVCRGSRLR